MTDFVVYRGDTNLENADKSEAGGDMIFHQFSRLRVVLSLDFISEHFEYELFFHKINDFHEINDFDKIQMKSTELKVEILFATITKLRR